MKFNKKLIAQIVAVALSMKSAKNAQGIQRNRCLNNACPTKILMHDIVIGAVCNKVEFGCDIHA